MCAVIVFCEGFLNFLMTLRLPDSGKLTRYAALILWIAVIFFLSTGNGSSEETSLIIGPLLRWLFPEASADLLDFYHAIIRKVAHPTVYGILAFLAARAFAYGRESGRFLRWLIPAFLVAAVVAAIDEFNQSYLPSRTGTPRDVVLDLSGAIVALAIYALWQRRRQKKGNRPRQS
jgi:VanZ family protein